MCVRVRVWMYVCVCAVLQTSDWSGKHPDVCKELARKALTELIKGMGGKDGLVCWLGEVRGCLL